MAGSVQACDRLHRLEVLTEEAAKPTAPREAKILGPVERAEPAPDLAATSFFLVAPRASKDGPATHLALATRRSRVHAAAADKGNVQFQVKGLVLAGGSASAFGLSGLPIGTPDGVTDVIGTRVCDIDGSAGGGTSTLVRLLFLSALREMPNSVAT